MYEMKNGNICESKKQNGLEARQCILIAPATIEIGAKRIKGEVKQFTLRIILGSFAGRPVGTTSHLPI